MYKHIPYKSELTMHRVMLVMRPLLSLLNDEFLSPGVDTESLPSAAHKLDGGFLLSAGDDDKVADWLVAARRH